MMPPLIFLKAVREGLDVLGTDPAGALHDRIHARLALLRLGRRDDLGAELGQLVELVGGQGVADREIGRQQGAVGHLLGLVLAAAGR